MYTRCTTAYDTPYCSDPALGQTCKARTTIKPPCCNQMSRAVHVIPIGNSKKKACVKHLQDSSERSALEGRQDWVTVWCICADSNPLRYAGVHLGLITLAFQCEVKSPTLRANNFEFGYPSNIWHYAALMNVFSIMLLSNSMITPLAPFKLIAAFKSGLALTYITKWGLRSFTNLFAPKVHINTHTVLDCKYVEIKENKQRKAKGRQRQVKKQW